MSSVCSTYCILQNLTYIINIELQNVLVFWPPPFRVFSKNSSGRRKVTVQENTVKEASCLNRK